MSLIPVQPTPPEGVRPPPPDPAPPSPILSPVLQPTPLTDAERLVLQATAQKAVLGTDQAWQDFYNNRLMELGYTPDNSVLP